MSKRESITRCNLIIKKLRKQSANFKEILEYLSSESELQSYNFNISKRTFQRDLDDIRSIYNIDIRFDTSNKVYFIDNEQQPEVNERLLEAFDIFNALNISDRLSNYIQLEQRKPMGTENLFGLLHAVRNRFLISFTYQKYWDGVYSERKVEPYFLKEFKNRWYIIANDLKDNHIKSFALDRLTHLDISQKKFTYPSNLNINELYSNCFGITGSSEKEPVDVILSFNPIQGKYMKSLKLHHSQEELVDNEVEYRIKLKIFITYDFIMELLSLGDTVKVLKPKSLVSEIKSVYQKALNQY